MLLVAAGEFRVQFDLFYTSFVICILELKGKMAGSTA